MDNEEYIIMGPKQYERLEQEIDKITKRELEAKIPKRSFQEFLKDIQKTGGRKNKKRKL